MLRRYHLPSRQVSHLVPLQSFKQVQENSPLVVSLQVPPFWQGVRAQGCKLPDFTKNEYYR